MGRTVAALAFIGVVAAAALYLAQKPTLIQGSVTAADITERLHDQGRDDVRVTCDDAPFHVDGALFHCRFFYASGATETVRVFLNREGKQSAELVESTGPTRGGD